MTKKIEITTIPELATSVGIHGSAKQQEAYGALVLAGFLALCIVL